MDESHKEGKPPPTTVAVPAVARKNRFTVTYLRENSPSWNRTRFRSVLEAEIEPEIQAEIGRRRTVLRNYAPTPLHHSYICKSHAGRDGPRLVTSDILAISPAYGVVLYNLARSIEAGLILEAGAGFGISSMYLAAAARRAAGGTLLSFEISNYAAIAQASVNLIDPGSRVIEGDFACFSSYLVGATEVDLAFIDAVHEKDAMLRSFRSLIGWMARRSMIIVDDLSYSESSREAFRYMMRMEYHDFVCIVNQRFGVLIKG